MFINSPPPSFPLQFTLPSGARNPSRGLNLNNFPNVAFIMCRRLGLLLWLLNLHCSEMACIPRKWKVNSAWLVKLHYTLCHLLSIESDFLIPSVYPSSSDTRIFFLFIVKMTCVYSSVYFCPEIILTLQSGSMLLSSSLLDRVLDTVPVRLPPWFWRSFSCLNSHHAIPANYTPLLSTSWFQCQCYWQTGLLFEESLFLL